MTYRNPMGYLCLPPHVLERAMGDTKACKKPGNFAQQMQIAMLEQFGIPAGNKQSGNECTEEPWLPELQGDNIAEHFEYMAEEFLKPAMQGIEELIATDPCETPDSELFRKCFRPGLTRFERTKAGWSVESVDSIAEAGAIYDCETFVQGSPMSQPILGTAINGKACYLWVSPLLFEAGQCLELIASEGLFEQYEAQLWELLGIRYQAKLYAWLVNMMLDEIRAISGAYVASCNTFKLESYELPSLGRGKVLVAHNSAFDNTRIAERYELTSTPVNYVLDTMSMHQLVAGLDASKRWAADAKEKHDGEVAELERLIADMEQKANEYGLDEQLAKQLADAKYKLMKLNHKSFPAWLKYGAKKSLVAAYNFHCGDKYPTLSKASKDTRDLFVTMRRLWQVFVNFDELLQYAMHDAIYTHRLFRALYPKYRRMAPSKVPMAAHMLLSSSIMPVDPRWNDWCLEVDTVVQGYNNEISERFRRLADEYHRAWQSGKLIAESDPWLKHLDWSVVGHEPDAESLPDASKPIARWYLASNGGLDLTPKKIASMYVLKMCWVKEDEQGNKHNMPLYKHKKLGIVYDDATNGNKPTRVPHKKGEGNVGSVLTSFYMMFIAQGMLSSEHDDALRIMQLMQLKSYWLISRDRVISQAVRPINNPLTGEVILACAPGVAPNNTVSLRTGEPLWLTLAAHTTPKPGAEIKSMAMAPPGFIGLGYDFDGQELQILGAGADSILGISGSTPLGCRLLSGDKRDKTDPHSVVATRAGISREAAKQSVYSMCYGGGVKSVSGTIRIWHPTYGQGEAEEFAKSTIASFKGVRPRGQLEYVGGEASQAFNWMLRLLQAPEPNTPLLGTRMTPAMWPANCNENGSPGQLNWFVQCGGASQMNAVLVAEWWLAKRMNIMYYLCCTMHDEIYGNVLKRDAYIMAYAKQIAHCWSWCLLHYKLGIADMPVGRAWVSGVSMDRVWRKEPSSDVSTPTHRAISPGKSLSMQDLHDRGVHKLIAQRWEAFNTPSEQ